MALAPSLSRRRFLQLGGFSAAMLALARMRAAAGQESGAPLRVLTPRDAAILTAIAARITDTGDAAMPRFADTPALLTVDRSLLYLDEGVRRQLHAALLLFEYGPMLFDWHFARFTELAPARQDAHIAGWRDSRFETRRLAYRAMKNLAFLGYYSQDDTWKGIHYLGPVLPLPRREAPA
jgi:hypothetical protein